MGWIVNRAKVQRDAVAAIERAGGSVKILRLKNTAVSDAGLEQLKKISSLHTLVLSGTKVTDAGVLGLQQALPKLKIVR